MSLQTVLNSLNPEIVGEYVYCVSEKSICDIAHLNPIVLVQEGPDLTIVLDRTTADANGLEYSGTLAYINLGVDTELELVGFTGVFSTALAEKGISANVVAGYHQDHLFVQWDKREEALGVLKGLGRN